MLKKKFLFLGLASLFLLPDARAGICQSLLNPAMHYFNIDEQSFPNQAGSKYYAYKESKSDSYIKGCDWTRNILYSTYINPILIHQGGSYYYFPNFPELLINVQTNVYNAETKSTTDFYQVPFYKINNRCNNNNCSFDPISSGSKAKINLILQKPIIGSLKFNNLLLYTLSASNFSYENDYGSWLAYGYLSIDLSVPENCVIDAGSIIEINFGQIESNEFNSTGQKPNSVNKITKNIPITCQGINPGAMLKARLTSSSNTQTDALDALNSEHVSFKFSDKDDKPLYINTPTSTIPFQLGTNYKADFSFKAWPISKDGKTPTPGKVNGQAFLILEYQ
jgi:minor fimbrial subunit